MSSCRYQIAATTKRPEKVIGMHFMNPVPVMRLVEIIRGLATSDEVYQIVEDASKKWAKCRYGAKTPGFVSNRVLQVMINEACGLYEGVARRNIDNIMTGHEPSYGTAG